MTIINFLLKSKIKKKNQFNKKWGSKLKNKWIRGQLFFFHWGVKLKRKINHKNKDQVGKKK